MWAADTLQANATVANRCGWSATIGCCQPWRRLSAYRREDAGGDGMKAILLVGNAGTRPHLNTEAIRKQEMLSATPMLVGLRARG